MKNKLIMILLVLFVSFNALAAYDSRFDAMNFDPTVDGGDYFTVYGTQMLTPWQAHAGFIFDYANKPLEFRGDVGGTPSRQSVLDQMYTAHFVGAVGITEWMSIGLDIPGVYNFFISDDAAAVEDNGFGMGDISVISKFRFLDLASDRVGLVVLPYITLPTGDIIRYNGSGHLTGGAKLALEFQPHERFNMALNAGYLVRDGVTENYVFPGLVTATVRMDDQFVFGAGANYKINSEWQVLAEVNGSTLISNFFTEANTNSLEALTGVRHYFADTGFSADLGGGLGLLDGVGTPLFRVVTGLRYSAPLSAECPKCPDPEPALPPDPRIKDNKIVLWGKIFYDTAKSTIRPISFPILDDVVKVLVDHPEISLVEVQGHTDARGSDELNNKLSQERAQASLDYLVSKGITASRLVAKGYGETKPIATNDTVEGMSQNRRTEFVILSSDGSLSTPPETQFSAPVKESVTEMIQEAPAQITQESIPATETVPVTEQGLPNYSN